MEKPWGDCRLNWRTFSSTWLKGLEIIETDALLSFLLFTMVVELMALKPFFGRGQLSLNGTSSDGFTHRSNSTSPFMNTGYPVKRL